MKLIPFHRFTLRTRLTPMEVFSRVQDDTDPLDYFRLFRLAVDGIGLLPQSNHSAKYFEGDAYPSGFVIRRILNDRNNFRPVIIGRIEREEPGSRVRVHMRPGLYTLAGIALFTVMGLWMIALILFRGQPAYIALAPGGFLLVVWALSTFAFWDDGESTITYLEIILNAEPSEVM